MPVPPTRSAPPAEQRIESFLSSWTGNQPIPNDFTLLDLLQYWRTHRLSELPQELELMMTRHVIRLVDQHPDFKNWGERTTLLNRLAMFEFSCRDEIGRQLMQRCIDNLPQPPSEVVTDVSQSETAAAM